MFENSTRVAVGILIIPNATDDWVNNSPFPSDPLVPGEVAYALWNRTDTSYAGWHSLPGRLTGVGPMDTSVDIFNGVQTVVEDVTYIKSIGGVGKVPTFKFNLTGEANISKLLGRRVEVWGGLPENPVTEFFFRGKIHKVSRGNRVVTVTVRGLSNYWDKSIGSIVEDNNSIYSGKIVPLNYGNLSDANAYAPVVVKSGTPKTDEKEQESMSELVFFDEQSGVDFKSDISANAGSVTTGMSQTSSYYVAPGNDNVINIWNPPRIAFLLGPHTSLISPVDEVYSVDGGHYQFLYYEDDLAYFTATDKVPPESGTLTKVSGNGSATIPYSQVSDILPPEIDFGSFPVEWSTPWTDIPTGAVNDWEHFSNAAGTRWDIGKFSAPEAEPVKVWIRDKIVQLGMPRVLRDVNYKYIHTTVFTDTVGFIPNDIIWKLEQDKTPVTFRAKASVHNLGFSMPQPKSFADNAILGSKVYPVCYLDLPDNFFTKTRQLGVVTMYTFPGDRMNLLAGLGLQLPEFGVNGTITKMYLRGEFSIEFESEATGQKDWLQASLLLVNRDSLVERFPHDDFVFWNPTSYVWLRGIKGRVNSNSLSATTWDTFDATFKFASGHVSHHLGLKGLTNYEWSATYPFLNISDLAILGRKSCAQVEDPTTSIVEKPDYVQVGFLKNHPDSVAGSLTIGDLKEKAVDSATRCELPAEGQILYEKSPHKYTTRPAGRPLTLQELKSSQYTLLFHFVRAYIEADGDTLLYKFTNPIFDIEAEFDLTTQQGFTRGSGRIYDPNITYSATGTGAIENPVAVIEDIARREVGLTDTELNTASLANSASALTTLAAGFSVFDQPVQFFDLVQQICQEFNLIVSEDRLGRLTVNSLVEDNISALIENKHILLKGDKASWSEEFSDLDKIFTDLTVKYQKRITDDSYQGVITNLSEAAADFTAASEMLGVEQPAVLSLDMVRDQSTAEKVALATVKFRTQPIRTLTVETDLTYYALELGQWVAFLSDTYVTETQNKRYLVVGKELTLPFDKEPKLKLKLVESTADLSNVYAAMTTTDDGMFTTDEGMFTV